MKERKVDSRAGYPDGRQKCGSTRLGKHRSEKPETGGREQLRWVECREKARCGRILVECRIGGRTSVVMVVGQIQEVEQISTRNNSKRWRNAKVSNM